MSEETLRRFLQRLNEDESFRTQVEKNPKGAFAKFGLSPAEQMAIASDDEDALRRLTGSDLEGYAALGRGGLDPAARAGDLNWRFSKYHCTWFCPTFICPTEDNWPTCCFQSCA